MARHFARPRSARPKMAENAAYDAGATYRCAGSGVPFLNALSCGYASWTQCKKRSRHDRQGDLWKYNSELTVSPMPTATPTTSAAGPTGRVGFHVLPAVSLRRHERPPQMRTVPTIILFQFFFFNRVLVQKMMLVTPKPLSNGASMTDGAKA